MVPGRFIFKHLVAVALGVVSCANTAHSIESHTLVVDPNGKGDFTTLTAAVNALPMFTYERVVIYIKNGVYHEKIRIEQDYITLRGESREGVRIVGNLPRQIWLDQPDPIGPAVVNLFGNDIVVENLTIENTQPDKDVHAFAIYGMGTRIILQHANIWSQGGDTVSLWNYKEGMYYHSNCNFRGAVDFVCPRGWCYIEKSQFHCVKNTAAIWHAGGFDKDQKFVLRDCSFEGEEHFELGRNHYDAQFLFLNCAFSDEVLDKPIYRVRYEDPSRNRPDNWGYRVYFHNSYKPGLEWTKDNLATLDPKLTPESITAQWTFSDMWNPESHALPRVVRIESNRPGTIDFVFNERITVRGAPVLTDGKQSLRYRQGGGSNQLTFEGTWTDFENLSMANSLQILSGELLGTIATCDERRFGRRP